MRLRGRAVLGALLGAASLATGCGGSSSGSTSSASSQQSSSSASTAKVVSLQTLTACLNKAFHSDNVESDVQPVNPPELAGLYATAGQHDVAVTLSNGGTAYVFSFPSASQAASAAKATTVSAKLVTTDNIVAAYVHSPPPASAPPTVQRKPLALITPPAKDGALVAACA